VFASLPDFMEKFLSKIPPDILRNTVTYSIAQKHTILESFWCHEFYRISYSLLQKDTYVHSNVQKVGKDDIDGKVDYVIKNGPDRTWVIEFLIRGDVKKHGTTDAQMHIERFSEKYKEFAKYEHLVVDFRPGTCAQKDNVSGHHNYWIVYYTGDREISLTVLTPVKKFNFVV